MRAIRLILYYLGFGDHPDDNHMVATLPTGQEFPVYQTAPGRAWLEICKGRCPACGTEKGFHQGPTVGLAAYVYCPECHAGFRCIPLAGTAERAKAPMPSFMTKGNGVDHEAKL